MIGATNGTQFVWTKRAQELHPGTKENEPVWEVYRFAVPKNWIDKGIVKEFPVSRILPIGQGLQKKRQLFNKQLK